MRRFEFSLADLLRDAHCHIAKLPRVVALAALSVLSLGNAAAHAVETNWIWSPQHEAGKVPQGECHFRKTFTGGDPKSAKLTIAADDEWEVYLNGKKIVSGSGWREKKSYNISKLVLPGTNILGVKVTNSKGKTAGLLARVEVTQQSGKKLVIASDDSWKTSLRPLGIWYLPVYRDARWEVAQALGGEYVTAPWNVGGAPVAGVAQASGEDDVSTDDSPAPAARRTTPASAVAARTSTEDEPVGQKEATPEDPLFRTQPKFEVQVIAAHAQTGSLIAAEFNEFEELIVARENGPLLLLVDTNADKIPDSPRVYCDIVKNVQGILPINGEVIVTADGPDGAGVYRLNDANRDGKLEVVETLLKFRAASEDVGEAAVGEHGPHGLALGPDGYIYVVVGNHSVVDGGIDEASPYRNYYEGDIVPRFEDPAGHARGIKAPGGTIVRIPSTGGTPQLVAGGLRNAYDLAFDQAGNLITHDSDMEADEGTTWYVPTQLLHIIPGGEYGWRSGWARWPNYWHDGLTGALETGRGSPTGVVVYDHFMYPEKYHHDPIVCDWTNGRLVHVEMKQEGATLTATSEVLLEGQPLNITDITVGPDGWLYFVTGGRDTNGSVYRLVYTGETPSRESKIGVGVPAVIRYPQFQSAWARQAIATIKQEDGAKWDEVMPAVARTKKNSVKFRTRSMDLMHLYGPPLTEELLRQLSADESPEVRAKSADLMGLAEASPYADRLAEMLADSDANVRRHVCEAIVRSGAQVPHEKLHAPLTSKDRFESAAARRAIAMLPTEQWQETILTTDNHQLFIEGATALLVAQGDKETALAVLARFQAILADYVSDDDFVDMLRLAAIAMERGEVTSDDVPELTATLASEFPSANKLMNRELLRLLVHLQAGGIGDRYLEYLKSNLDEVERLQVAVHLALLQIDWTSEQRLGIVEALERTLAAGGGASRSGYVQNVTRQFAGQLNADEQRIVLAKATDFPNAALAVLFQLPEKPDAETITSLRETYLALAKNKTEAGSQLQVGIIAVMGNSADDESMAFLRTQYLNDPDRQSFISMALAQVPAGDNWPLLVDALRVAEGNATPMVLDALAQVPVAPDTAEPYRQTIIRALQLGDSGGDKAIALLQHWTGETLGAETDDVNTRAALWQKWFAKKYPQEPPATLPVAANDSKWIFDDLLLHLQSDKAKEGSATRGATVFTKAQCAKCHRHGSSGESIGPDLTTVAQRFRKKEILESILYPSHTISDQYRSKVVIASNGKQYTGIVAGGAPGEIVVLQQDGRKVVLKENDVEETLPSKISAMPDGLLDNLTLQEVTDLFTFLTSPPESRTATRPRR